MPNTNIMSLLLDAVRPSKKKVKGAVEFYKVLSLLKESEKSSLSTDKIVEDLAWKRINI